MMALPPELIAEILLRLLPDDPACLVRASLVCNLWRRMLSDPEFPHHYREVHGTPPLLGFLRGFYHSNKQILFVPTTTRTTAPFLQPPFGCRALDCRHGRVLFDTVEGSTRESLAVWDPITGDDTLLADPDPGSYCGSGAVLCAAGAGCNHRCCHGGPFFVVFVSTSYAHKAAGAWVYSSEAAAWSAPACVPLQHAASFVARRRAAIVGDQIYFLLSTGAEILKYDLGEHCLTVIGSPGSMYNRPVLVAMENSSSLGFIGVKDSTLHLWAAKVNPDGSVGWVQDRVILLNNLVRTIRTPSHTYNQVNVIGFAEGVDTILLGNNGASAFMFDLKSDRFRQLINNPMDHYYDVFPYMTFYIPDFASSKLPLPMETE